MIEFMAILKSMSRDSEDASKVTLECASSEFPKVVMIPAQALLKVSIDVVDSDSDMEDHDAL